MDHIKIVSLKDSDVKSLKDLSGKTAGFTSPGSGTELVLKTSLKRAGVSDVRTRAAGGTSELTAALDGGAVDSGMAQEPQYTVLEKDKYNLLAAGGDYLPDFTASVVFSSQEFVEQNPDVVRRFLAARAKAIEAIEGDPASAAVPWAEALELEAEPIVPLIEDWLEIEAWGGPGGALSVEGLRAVETSMKDLGQLPATTEIPWADMINQDFLPDSAERINPEEISAGG
jgi:NitT/TauT family transport system substrate-binding protein